MRFVEAGGPAGQSSASWCHGQEQKLFLFCSAAPPCLTIFGLNFDLFFSFHYHAVLDH